MKLSRIEANWIASKLLSDAEQERERSAQRRTAWLTIFFPELTRIRPTERVTILRDARARSAREPMIIWPTALGFLLFASLYLGVVALRQHLLVYLTPTALIVGNFLAQYLRTRVLLRRAVI